MNLLIYGCFLGLLMVGGCASKGDNSMNGETSQTTPTGSSEATQTNNATGLFPGDVAPDARNIDADRLYPFQEGFAVVTKGNAQALLDQKGAFFIPYNQYLFGAMQGAYWEENGRYHHVSSSEPGFHRGLCLTGVKSQDQYGSDRVLWGCINTKKEWIIPAKYYDFRRQTGENLFLRSAEHGNEVCFNRQGDPVRYPGCWLAGQVVQPALNTYGRSYQNPYLNSSDQVLIVQGYQGNSYKYGLAYFSGKSILEPAYDQIEPFSEGLAAAMKNDAYGQPKWGFINTKGEIVIPMQYSNQPHAFHCGRALVEPKDKTEFDYAYIDIKGEIKIRLRSVAGNWNSDQVSFRNGLVISPNVYGLLDIDGQEYNLGTIQGSFQDVETGQQIHNIHHNGLINSYELEEYRMDQILVSHASKKGLTDIQGRLLLPPIFTELSLFDSVSGLAYARYENRARGIKREGYINTKGVFVLLKGQQAQW